MTSTSAPTKIAFRVFSSSDVKGGAAVALGRLHASWFLVLARPDEVQMIRAFRCINFILPDDPTAIAALSAGGKHLFAVGGHLGDTLMDELTSLLDHEGRAPVKVVEAYPEDHPCSFCALVEVLVPDEELIYACGRCGKWEAQFGPRFPRCSGCKSRYYCSVECQREDWKPAYHRGECALLREGKAYEVECRRKLHDNGWYFENGGLGVKSFLAGTGEYEWERAYSEGDWEHFAYGTHTPPHDVPPSATSRPKLSREAVASMDPDVPPPGFISTGDPQEDRTLIKRFRATILGTDPVLPPFLDVFHTPGLAPNIVPEHDIPVYPSLPVPQAPGFVFTGDPLLDDCRLEEFLDEHGTDAERAAYDAVGEQRTACIEARAKLMEGMLKRSRACKRMIAAHSDVVRKSLRAIQRAQGGAERGDDGEDEDEELMSGLKGYGSDSESDSSEDGEECVQPSWRSRISVL
ncbi:hypothetical protein OH76DRAFT_1405530 [Lentinus brumalis]|uniref:MYND-type domain-containing protein n=1 Tax=Lentinus brumalis TaxID=2498619 RepID=A0A371D5F2_9APHY|nr:hypothetical protein OH76DRAFT_1405530 [Polyporus brumalis]